MVLKLCSLPVVLISSLCCLLSNKLVSLERQEQQLMREVLLAVTLVSFALLRVEVLDNYILYYVL
jgi:hypothetical protein